MPSIHWTPRSIDCVTLWGIVSLAIGVIGQLVRVTRDRNDVFPSWKDQSDRSFIQKKRKKQEKWFYPHVHQSHGEKYKDQQMLLINSLVLALVLNLVNWQSSVCEQWKDHISFSLTLFYSWPQMTERESRRRKAVVFEWTGALLMIRRVAVELDRGYCSPLSSDFRLCNDRWLLGDIRLAIRDYSLSRFSIKTKPRLVWHWKRLLSVDGARHRPNSCKLFR